MYTVGQQIGTMFPEIYEEDEDMEDCPPFVEYTGEDTCFIQMNEAVERWDSWVPQSPIKKMLKMVLIVMSSSEPESWSFTNDSFKKYESDTSYSDDSSDDEQLFSKKKTIKTKKFKKLVEKEKLSFE